MGKGPKNFNARKLRSFSESHTFGKAANKLKLPEDEPNFQSRNGIAGCLHVVELMMMMMMMLMTNDDTQMMMVMRWCRVMMMMIKASFNKQQRKEYRIISAATPPPPHSSAFLSVTASHMCLINKKATEERLRISAATQHRQASMWNCTRPPISHHQSGHIISLVRTRPRISLASCLRWLLEAASIVAPRVPASRLHQVAPSTL